MKRLFLFICVACMFSIEASAQQYKPSFENLTPVSPTAFQFLKYTEMPVSEYTGIPNISIPLYEINEDGVSVPLTLSYHAAGIRVNQEASWIGLGWDLNIGSVVQTIYDGDDYGNDPITGYAYTRQMPDYHNSPVPSEFPLRYQYPFGTDGPTWSNPYPVYQPQAANSFKIATDHYVPVNGDFATQQTNLFTARWIDSEPDVFKANFLGHSISFMRQFNPDRIVVINKKGYVVTRVNGNWKIITPSGDEFYFEEKSSITTQSQTIDPNSNTGSAYEPSSNIWMLTKIITKNKKQITFSYSRTGITDAHPNYSEKWQKSTLISTNTYTDYTGYSRVKYSGSPSNLPIPPNWITKTFSRSKEDYMYLSSITFPKGQVLFTTSSRNDMAGGKKLDNIQINSTVLIKSFQFNYDYATATTGNGFSDASLITNHTSQRLRLLSVQDNSGATYQFTYNTTQLPWKNSFAQDYWGFYNGRTSDTSLIPNPYQFNLFSLGNNGNNHSANLQYAKAGILEEIKYPTGGKAIFEYELNEFDNYWVPDFSTSANQTSKGYGLRIKSVTFKESDATQSRKVKYTYTGGKAILPLQLFRNYNYNTANINGNIITINSYTMDESGFGGFYSSSLFGSVNGVGYNKVIKEEVDLAGVAKGKTETVFHNNPDLFIHSAVTGCQTNASLPAIKNYNYPENGLVDSVAVFNDQNSLIKKVKNNYTNINYAIYYGARVFGYTSLIYAECGLGQGSCIYYFKPQDLIGYYPIFDFESLLQSTNSTDFTNNGNITNSSSYIYDELNRLTSATTVNSGSQEKIDYSYPTASSTPAIIASLFQRNRLLDLTALRKYWISEDGFTQKATYAYKKEYIEINDKILESKVSIINPFPYDVTTDEIFYDVYDPANGNLLQYTNKGITKSIIWDYNGEYLIAEGINTAYSSFAHTSFESAGIGNWTFTNSPIISDATAPTGKKVFQLDDGVYSYTIQKSNLQSGTTYLVSYWSNGGSKTVSGTTGSVVTGRSVNGWTYYEHTVTGVTSTVISGSGRIDELRLYPKGALMTTYTYEPLIGMTTQCDANNRISYYEYDAFNRLSIVRDQDKNIIKRICYNYQSQPENCVNATGVYYNTVQSQSFTKSCTSGGTGTSVTYTVPAGRYSAASQAAADALAQTEISANGQAFANSNGVCTWSNTATSVTLTRNNCPSGYTAGQATYTVAAGKHLSTISQTDADAKATADKTANGQNYVNANATCTPPAQQTIYAKRVYSNYTYTAWSSYADVEVKFYSDAACTVPVSVTNLVVNYAMHYQVNGGSPTIYNYSITCNGTSTLILSQTQLTGETSTGAPETRSYFITANGTLYTPVN